MEAFISSKDAGITKMQDEKYEQAIADFTVVIDNLDAKTDDEGVLKSVCLLNRSACLLKGEKYEEALEDANSVVKLYNSLRTEEMTKDYDAQKIENDKLTVPLSLAYVRRGQVFESQTKLLDALHEYSVSTTLKFDGDGQAGMKSVFARIGIPEIDQHDQDLQLFSVILIHLLSEVNLLTALTNLLTYLTEGNPDEKWVGKINNTGCCRLVYGALQLYIDNEMIVVACVTALRVLAEKGAVDAFNGFIVLRVACEHWLRSVNVVADILRLLALSPPQLMPYLARTDFIPVCIEALDLQLKDEEFDCVFYLLFHLSQTQEQLVQLGAEGAVEKALEKKSHSALLFLSKTCQLNDNSRIFEREGGVEWVLEMIAKEPTDKQVVSACSILIAQTFMVAAEDRARESPTAQTDEVLAPRGLKVFEALFPIATKFSKEAETVSNIFAALASCVEYAKQYVHDNRVIQAASAILAQNIKDDGCALNIVSLFYACTINEMKDEINNTRSAMPTLLSALKDHSDDLLFVERAVGVLFEVDHPKKNEFFAAAIKQQPASPILLKYKNMASDK